MTKRVDLAFAALRVPMDALMLAAASATAYALRLSEVFIEARPLLQEIDLAKYIAATALFIVVWLGVFAVAGLYRIAPRRLWNEWGRVIIASSATAMIIISTIFFRREFTASRFLVLAVWGASIVYICTARTLLTLVRKALLRRGVGAHAMALVGNGKTAKDLIDVYKVNPELGYKITHTFKNAGEKTYKDIEKLARARTIESVLIADGSLPQDEVRDLVVLCENRHVGVRLVADMFVANAIGAELSTGEGVPILEPKRTLLDGWGRIAKRVFDVVGASVALLVFSPIILTVAVLSWFEDGAPVFFRNRRIGEKGKPFQLLKLRSMWRKYCVGPQFKEKESENLKYEEELLKTYNTGKGPVNRLSEEDPRITPLGRFTRRWSIDELPQFWNVLMGDMSLVGPRPHQPQEVDKYEAHHLRVLAIKPGITGMGQVSGRRDLDFNDEARLDTWYIEHWSIWLDVYILLKTPYVVLSKKGSR